MKRTLKDVTLIRSDRRTLSVSVAADLTIVVRVPRRCPAQDVLAFLQRQERWIDHHVALQREQQQKQAQIPALSEQEREAMRERTRVMLQSLVPPLAARIGVTYTRIRVGFARTRFASRSTTGTLSFHAALCRMPPFVVEYLIIHELCHVIHMDHSAAFWALVGQYCSDVARARAWLQDEGVLWLHA